MAATELKSAVELGNFVEQSVELKSLKTTVESAQEKVEKQKALNALLTRMELRKDPTTGKYTIKLDDPKDPTGCGTYEFTSPDLLQGFAKSVLKMEGNLSIVEKNGAVEMHVAESAITNQVDDLKQTIAINAPSNVTITNNVTTTYTETSTGSTTGTTSNSTADATGASTNTASTSTASADAKKISGGSTDVSKDTAAKKETPATDATGAGKEAAKDATTTNANEKAGENQNTEVAKEKTKEEKLAEAQKLIEGMGLEIKQIASAETGTQKVIDLTPAQYDNLSKIMLDVDMKTLATTVHQSTSTSGGSNPYLSQFNMEETGEKKAPQTKLERKIARTKDRSMNAGSETRRNNLAEKLEELQMRKAKLDANYAAHAMNAANAGGKSEWAKRAGDLAMGANTPGNYTGESMHILPYTPRFVGICQSVNGLRVDGTQLINLGGEQVLLRGPEWSKNTTQFTDVYNGQTGYTRNVADANPNSLGNKAADWLANHTNMSRGDAKGALNTVGYIAGGAAIVGALNWLFLGKNMFKTDGKFDLAKKMEDSMLWRIGGLLVGAAGLNLASKAANGRPLRDNIKDTYNGKMELKDWYHSKNSTETAMGVSEHANKIMSGVNYGMISPAVENTSDGKVTLNAQKRYNALQNKVNTTTGVEQQRWNKKLQEVKALVDDNALQQQVNALLAGTTLAAITDPNKATETFDAKITGSEAKRKALLAYAQEKGYAFADGKSAELLAYTTDEKMTPEEAVKNGILVKKGEVAITTTGKTPEASTDVLPEKLKGLQSLVGKNGYTVENLTKLYDASQTINGEHAGKVGFQLSVDEKGVDDGILYVRYDNSWNIPLIITDGSYQIANFNHQFSVDKAAEALNVAAITGYLIVNNRGTANPGVKTPYSVGWDNALGRAAESVTGHEGDLHFNDGVKTFGTTAVDGEDRWSSTAAEKGGDVFQKRMKVYADWLNGLTTTSTGKSIWEKGSAVTNWKDMNYMAQVRTDITKANEKRKEVAPGTTNTANTGTTNTGSTNVVPVVAPSPEKTDTKNTTTKKKEGGNTEKEPVAKRTPEDAKKELDGLNDSITKNTPEDINTKEAAKGRRAIIEKTTKLLNEVYPQLDIRVVPHQGYIDVFSHGNMRMKVDTKKACLVDDQYDAKELSVTPDRWRDLIRMACLTNWIKRNYKQRSQSTDTPFELSGEDIQFDGKTFRDELGDGEWRRLLFDVDVVDNEDNANSTAKQIGGTSFQSQHAAYKDRLNTMKNSNGESIWRKGTEDKPMPENITDAQKEVLQYIGQVKDSFNGLGSTDGIGTEPQYNGNPAFQIEKIAIDTKVESGAGWANGSKQPERKGSVLSVKYSNEPVQTKRIYMNFERGEIAYKNANGEFNILAPGFHEANRKDMLAAAVLADSAIARYAQQGSSETPVNRGWTGDLEIALRNFSQDGEIIESSDGEKFAPWVMRNKVDYMNWMNSLQIWKDSYDEAKHNEPHTAAAGYTGDAGWSQQHRAGSF